MRTSLVRSRRIRHDVKVKTLDLTHITTYIVMTYLVGRILCLLKIALMQPPNQAYQPNWLLDEQTKKAAAITTPIEYSKLKGLRSSSGRTFLKYVSSPWEIKWSTYMDDFVSTNTVCHQVSFDTDLIRDFLNATCTSKALDQDIPLHHQGWCKLDDVQQPLFFNTANGKISGSKPGPLKDVEFIPPGPMTISDPDSPVFPKMVYRDNESGEIVFDYIEPLIGRLRHPLDCCEYAYQIGANLKKPPDNCLATNRLGTTRTQFIPPSSTSSSSHHKKEGKQEAHFFDSGSMHWKRHKSALTFVSTIWKRHGIEFDHFHVYEGQVSKDTFMTSVPEQERPRIDYRETDPSNQTDFIKEIVSQTTPDDYVVLKLKLGHPSKELEVWQQLLDNRLNILDHLDELLYTIPIPPGVSADSVQYKPWYDRFLQLRREGIRDHAFTEEL